MSRTTPWWRRRRRRRSADFAEEIRAHLAVETDTLRKDGLSEADARSAARRAFGNLTAVQERFYESTRWLAWDHLISDLRYAARTLARSPGLVITLVFCLGLGIGVNTTLFGLFNAAVLMQPSGRDPHRLMNIEPGNSDQVSYPNFRDLRGHPAFEGLFISSKVTLNLRTGTGVEQVHGLQVSGNFFDVVGVQPFIGRTFGEGEHSPEQRAQVAVLDHGFWTRRFGADREVVGRTLTLNGEPFVVIGVLAASYRPITALFVPALYVPVSAVVAPSLDNRGASAFDLGARLAPGISRRQGEAAFTATAQALEVAHPKENKSFGERARIIPVAGVQSLQGRGKPSEFYVLLVGPVAIFGLLLLIACANVAGVLLARGASRRHEIAVRLALGASRPAVVRMLLVECFLICALGTAGGLLFTIGAVDLLARMQLPDMLAGVRVPPIAMDGNMVAYSVAIALSTCLVCGLAPALRATRVNLTPGLREAVASARQGRRLRTLLVGGQVAASVLLLTLCLLFLRSLQHVATLSPGFDVGRGVTAQVAFDRHRVDERQVHTLAGEIVDRLEALPGVTSASFASLIPLGGDMVGRRAELRDPSEAQSLRVNTSNVGPKYFETMGIALAHGREFLPIDRQGATPVAMVNAAFVRRAYADGEAVGRHLRVASQDPEPWREIVGVVADHRYAAIGDTIEPQVFLPYLQSGGRLFVQARVIGAPATYLEPVKGAITDIDPNLLVTTKTTKDATSLERTVRRLSTMLLGAMGALGLLLASIGLFGVLTWDVSRRTAEIGVRMTLGASRLKIQAMVVRDAVFVVAPGALLGVCLALLLRAPIRGFLVGTSTADPLAVGSVASVLLLVAALASWIPARRASAIDPVTALRRE